MEAKYYRDCLDSGFGAYHDCIKSSTEYATISNITSVFQRCFWQSSCWFYCREYVLAANTILAATSFLFFLILAMVILPLFVPRQCHPGFHNLDDEDKSCYLSR